MILFSFDLVYTQAMRWILFLILFPVISVAAPHPTTSSSMLNQLKSNLVFSQFGFKLNSSMPGWTLTETTKAEGNKDQKQIDLKYQTARISFSYDETKTPVNLEIYVKKFLRDYNQFGFEVSGLQSIKNNNKSTSIILDLNQKNKKTRSRQVFFQNGKKIVTATCVDDFETFDRSIKDCNKVIGSFYWN